MGQGAQHVVGFVSLAGEDGDVERLDDLLDTVHLVAQFVWHPRSVGLVLGVLLVAEGLAGIKGDDDIVGLFLTPRLEQLVDKHIDGVRPLAFRCGENTSTMCRGMVATIGYRVSINEQHPGGHGALLLAPDQQSPAR